MLMEERKLKAYEEIKEKIDNMLEDIRLKRKCRYNEGLEDALVKLDSIIIMYENGLLEHIEKMMEK